MFNKCQFKSTPAYKSIKRFLHTNVNTDIPTNPILYHIVHNIYKKIIDTPLSNEPSRYANKNCQLIFKFLEDLDFTKMEANGQKLFKVVKKSEYIEYTPTIRTRSLEEITHFADLPIPSSIHLNVLPNLDYTLNGVIHEADAALNSKTAALMKNFKTIKISKKDLEYLVNAYGNSQRSDYGTGYEVNFLCFIYSLNKFTPIDVVKSMSLYHFTSRILILKFKLEAAGSKGVWGVDDYEIVSFYLMGAVCDRENPKLKLSQCYHIPFVKNLIQFVCCYKNSVKLDENSPYLYDLLNETGFEIIISVEERIERELFGSFVVMQHFIHSTFLPRVEVTKNNNDL